MNAMRILCSESAWVLVFCAALPGKAFAFLHPALALLSQALRRCRANAAGERVHSCNPRFVVPSFAACCLGDIDCALIVTGLAVPNQLVLYLCSTIRVLRV